MNVSTFPPQDSVCKESGNPVLWVIATSLVSGIYSELIRCFLSEEINEYAMLCSNIVLGATSIVLMSSSPVLCREDSIIPISWLKKLKRKVSNLPRA
jgi:hypothetical protein